MVEWSNRKDMYEADFFQQPRPRGVAVSAQLSELSELDLQIASLCDGDTVEVTVYPDKPVTVGAAANFSNRFYVSAVSVVPPKK